MVEESPEYDNYEDSKNSETIFEEIEGSKKHFYLEDLHRHLKTPLPDFVEAAIENAVNINARETSNGSSSRELRSSGRRATFKIGEHLHSIRTHIIKDGTGNLLNNYDAIHRDE